MKLIYIAPMLHLVGGLERTLTDKANYLVEKGHKVMCLTYKQGTEKIFYPLDRRVLHQDIDCHIHDIYRSSFFLRFGIYLKLRHKFRERFSMVLSTYCPDAVVITVPNTEDFLYDMVELAKKARVKVIVESHLASYFHDAGKPSTERFLCRIYPSIRAIRQSDLLIALTESDAQIWREKHVHRVAVLPNPLSDYTSKFRFGECLEGRIVAVGRLFEQKRFDRMIDAFSRIASRNQAWYIDIFGEGPLRDTLQSQIERLGMEHRIRLNPPTHDIYKEYQCSQFFLLSSDFEGFGMVIIEAMACGIPVVSTDCPCGPSEIIEDGKTGLLAKMEVQDLADKMEWMITHEEERKAMGARAHQAAARYRKEVVMPEWEKAYLSVIGKSK